MRKESALWVVISCCFIGACDGGSTPGPMATGDTVTGGGDAGGGDTADVGDARGGDTVDVGDAGGGDTVEPGDSNLLGDNMAGDDVAPGDSSIPGDGLAPGDQSACVEATRHCTDTNQVATCTGGQLVVTESCPFACEAGNCTDDVSCTPHALRCNDATVEVCSAAGSSWLFVMSCPATCEAGRCVDACVPATTRCRGDTLEVCDEEGTNWDDVSTCGYACSVGYCVEGALDLALDTSLDGDLYVDGPVIIRFGTTVTVPSGELNLHASSITVEAGATVVVEATTMGGPGRGGAAGVCTPMWIIGGSGGYGTAGANNSETIHPECAGVGQPYGSAEDAVVERGSQGGVSDAVRGGYGGGVLRFYADTIEIAGEVYVDGADGLPDGEQGSGAGSGGGALLMAPIVEVSGTISTQGGMAHGTCCGYPTSYTPAGDGRVKLLAQTLTLTGSTVGVLTQGLLPPTRIYSSTHPDPTYVYNDGAPWTTVSWERPFAPVLGYYWDINAVPGPANGVFVGVEQAQIALEDLSHGNNVFRVVSVDIDSTVGAIDNRFVIQINTTPPSLSSASHPNPGTWYDNNDVMVSWTAPGGEDSYRGYHYVIDHFGITAVGQDSIFVPADQLQVMLADLDPGIWAVHMTSEDLVGYRTRAARHLLFRVGVEPAVGAINGRVEDESTTALEGVRVTINRELFGVQTTGSPGGFNFQDIPVGSWELTVSKDGFASQAQTVTVAEGVGTNLVITLLGEP